MHLLNLTVLLGLVVATNSVTLEDLMNALHTQGQKLWTRYRSFDVSCSNQVYKCAYVELRCLKPGEYRYLQHYELGRSWRSNDFYAELRGKRRGAAGPIMRVSPLPGGQGVEYTLRFWNATEHCAVFTRLFSGSRHCEMHVWEDHVDEDLPQCQIAFKKYCHRQPQYAIYTPDCQP
ncbi:uncharacterized protein LOC142589065 [Dermacentor variabilis]|uniref:uncharacterized protein LOC142589065 n=1 Tax=Dermacentor variabilis TaxID=34621 RepID=UPI003F5C85B9